MIHPYATTAYAQVLAGEGHQPVAVDGWGTTVLRRPICGTEEFDATGCYPVAVIDGNANLPAGLAALREQGLVSLVLVLDPFIRPAMDDLQSAFDFVRPFKTHYIRDCHRQDPGYSKHHRYELSRSSATVRRIELKANLDDWCRLYDGLVERRGIRGMAKFSRESFMHLADLPGLFSFGAFIGESMVGAHHWIACGGRVHSHLAASDDAGFSSGASYALYDAAINFFCDATTIDFGGGAGLSDNAENGLSRFKRGFANHTEMAYLCGKILDSARYEVLCRDKGTKIRDSTFFPAYRDFLESEQGAKA